MRSSRPSPCRLRRTRAGRSMVEVAGVEPVRVVHLFALICICLHLSLLISTLSNYRDAGKCRWMHLNAGKLANNWQIEIHDVSSFMNDSFRPPDLISLIVIFKGDIPKRVLLPRSFALRASLILWELVKAFGFPPSCSIKICLSSVRYSMTAC
jgi:hypothetical protein